MITDDPIRDLEHQLISAAARRSAVAESTSALPLRRRALRRRRWAVATAIAGAASVAALAGAPFGVFEGSDTPSGVSILRTAAAVAADRPTDASAYRYTEVLERDVYMISRGAQRASITLEQAREQWIDRGGRGRQVLRASRIVARTGDPALQAELPSGLQAPGEQPYPPPGSAQRPLPLDEVPSDAGALLQKLTAGYRSGRISDGSRPSPSRERYQVTTLILQLLSDADATPAQRGALFEALARMKAVTSLGTITDPLGRRGQAVAISTIAADPLPGARFEVIFDPATSELLTWTVTNDVPTTSEGTLTERTHTIVRAGDVDRSDARP